MILKINASNVEKCISDHPSTGRFNTVILFGNECALESMIMKFKGFVRSTLKTSGYDLLDYGYE